MINEQSASNAPVPQYPTLMSDAEIEAQFSRQPVAEPLRYQPFALVRQHNPEIASKIQLLWGSRSFADLIQILACDASGAHRAPLRRDVVNAIFALGRLHAESGGNPLAISEWVIDASVERPRLHRWRRP